MRNLPWLRGKEYPLLIAPTLALLAETGKPYVLENVMGAKLSAGWLCGQMFGLPFLRHRYFAANWLWLAPPHPRHWGTIRPGPNLGSRARDIAIPSMTGGLERHFRQNGARKTAANVGHAAGFQLARKAMACEWMRREELTQAIPPAYTEHIGRQLLAALPASHGLVIQDIPRAFLDSVTLRHRVPIVRVRRRRG